MSLQYTASAADGTGLPGTDRQLAASEARRLGHPLNRSRPPTGEQIARIPLLRRLALAACHDGTVYILAYSEHCLYVWLYSVSRNDHNVTLIATNIGRQLLDGMRFWQGSGQRHSEGITMAQDVLTVLSSLCKMQASDRHRDGETDRILTARSRLHSIQRGKSVSGICGPFG